MSALARFSVARAKRRLHVITYGWEPVEQLLRDGLADLAREQWEATARDKDRITLDVDWDWYRKADGMTRWFACRVDGELAGYIVCFVMPSPRYKTVIHGIDDTFWLSPRFRKGRVGVDLFIEWEKALAELGVVKAYLHERPELTQTRTRKGSVGRLFERLGWRRGDISYSKMIGR